MLPAVKFDIAKDQRHDDRNRTGSGATERSGRAAETTARAKADGTRSAAQRSELAPASETANRLSLGADRQEGLSAFETENGSASLPDVFVERTVWEWGDYRNDIYIPLCYDAVGTKAHLKVIMDTAALRAQGMSPAALKAEIENRYKNKTYQAPEKPGLSYMVAPVMRALGPPDMKMHTMAMPHLMFYAPNVTNEDIGATPDLAVPSSLNYPFIDRQGIAEQSYMIQLIGEAEKAKIVANEKTLLHDLCAHRDVLCLPDMAH